MKVLKYEVLVNFAGKKSGHVGQIITITDKSIADDLLKAGYIKTVKTATKGRSKGVEADGNE